MYVRMYVYICIYICIYIYNNFYNILFGNVIKYQLKTRHLKFGCINVYKSSTDTSIYTCLWVFLPRGL